MTLPAHGGPFVHLLVAALAIGVEGLHQGWSRAGFRQLMAIRAALIFGGFVFHRLTVFVINMVADVAFFDLGEFVVRVMPENGRRAPGILKYTVINQFHVLLRVGTEEKSQNNQ